MILMKVTAGKVVNGHVEVEGLALPEGVDVIIGFPESAEVAFELTESDEDLLAPRSRKPIAVSLATPKRSLPRSGGPAQPREPGDTVHFQRRTSN